jgi:uncharacterized protein
MEQILKIFEFVLKSFLHIWPYLLVTIPLAVVVNISGASKYITGVFGKKPILSILLATIIGAFSPFCSCGVIPVISSLLIGGVPLAPVMSFWIASPSMDPEIFFLSSSLLGWKLAIWRLLATFIISLLAGYLTHFAAVKGFIGKDVLRTQRQKENPFTLRSILNLIRNVFVSKPVSAELIVANPSALNNICCMVNSDQLTESCDCSAPVAVNLCNCEDSDKKETISLFEKIFPEIVKATFMVIKFMGLAFFITALITFYLPQNFITVIVSGNSLTQVLLATLIGIPMYTSNITALPMVGAMIDLGLNKGAALSFLIAGATTTFPAMVAVWGITKRRVFLLYISYALFGALLAGLLFNLFS